VNRQRQHPLPTRLSVRADGYLVQKATALARSQGISLSEWVRRAMREKMSDVLEQYDPVQDIIDAIDKVSFAVPDPERHVLFLRCPLCRQRIWNQTFTTGMAYYIHYQEHLLEDEWNREDKEERREMATSQEITLPEITPDNGKNGLFLRVANYVSEAMGRPANIITWLAFVVAWTLIFALGGPHLASGKWLPAWFDSEGYNFPLNLITTVAELFIGFLVAAATNRAEQALMRIIDGIKTAVGHACDVLEKVSKLIQHVDEMDQRLDETTQANLDLSKEIHRLTQEVHELVSRQAG
jgi:low affinity Fe/Cu permease